MRRKTEKLLIITPSGKEYEIGFLSPCKDGFVLGTSQIGGMNTSHLTVLSKKGTVSSHITPQYQGSRVYFPSITKKEILRRYQSLVEDQMLFQLPQEQLSQNLVYVTKKLFNLLDSLKKAIYQKRSTKKEKIHILNFMRAAEKAPKLFKKIMDSPQSFFGMCKAEDLLKDKLKIAGMTDSKIIVVRYRRKLYGIHFSSLMAFNFVPSTNTQEARTPLTEVYESFGVPQYLKEIERKKFFEKLLKNDSDYSSASNTCSQTPTVKDISTGLG